MSPYKPDLGLYHSKTTSPGTTFSFIPFKMFMIARIEQDYYSTTSNMGHEGREFCVTLDFDQKIFEQLINIIPEQISKEIIEIFQKPFEGPQMVNLPLPIEIEVSAKLSNKVLDENGKYIPFEVIGIFPT